jgi:hypothetical protein
MVRESGGGDTPVGRTQERDPPESEVVDDGSEDLHVGVE